MGEQSKLYAARAQYAEAQKGQDKAPHDDDELNEKRHDRMYNPIDDAKKGSIASELNADSARYRKGPGPL